MKILIVSQYFWPEPYKVNDIAEYLQSRGHQVEVLTGLPSAPRGKYYPGYGFWRNTKIGLDAEIFGTGIPVHRARILPRGQNFISLTLNCLTFIWAGKRLARQLAQRNYDLIFCNQLSPVSSISPARALVKRCGTRLVTYVYDIWPESMYFLLRMSRVPHWFDRLCRRYCQTLYSTADDLLITSPGMSAKLQSMGISQQRISYLPQSSDPVKPVAFDPELAAQWGISATDFVVTFAGNLGRAQSLDTLLAAARVILKTSPTATPVKFLLIGDGTEKAKIARQIIDEKLHNVQLIGWVNKDDLTRFFSLTSAFVVLLEDNEVLNLTLPAKVQTYMAAGKPILAAASPGGNSELARVIKVADCGLVSPSGDPETLAFNIQRLAQYSKAELRKLGTNARTYSRENFDQNTLYRQLEQRLERISQGRIE